MVATRRPARASPKRWMKLGYTFGLRSHLGGGARAFTDEIGRLTGGNYTIDHYPDGALGGELEMMNSVIDGEIDLALLTNGGLATLLPELGIIDIPFLFRDTTHARAVLDGPIGRGYLQAFEKKQMVALAWGENGLRHLTNSLRPIHGPDDLHDLHLRVPQSAIMLKSFQALGARPEELAFPALYGALDDGRFDGEENPISVIEAAKFYRVQKHLSLTGHVYAAAVFLMAQDRWDDLSGAEQTSFVSAAKAGGAETRRLADEAQREGVARLATQGMNIVQRVDREAFAAALAPTLAEFGDAFGPENIRQIKAFQ